MLRLRHFISAICVCHCITVGQAGWLKDLKSGKAITVSKDVSVRVDEIANFKDRSSYLASHVLRIELGDIGLTIAKARAKGQKGVQVGFYTPNVGHGEQGRGETKVLQVFLPLMIGFKVAGTILITLVAVIIVSLKAFLASKAALLLTASVALKKLWDYDHHANFHYPAEHSHAHDGYNFPPQTGYSHITAPTSYGPSSHEAADSNISEQRTEPPTVSQTVSPTIGTVPFLQAHMTRRVFKQKQQIVPLVTLHKVTKYQSN